MLAPYRLLTRAVHPALPLYLRLRASHGKEDNGRMREKLGFPSLARPAGKKLLWLHAASVGEAQSALPLIAELQRRYPRWWMLMTTGTVTSARLMKERLPAGAFHQYAPLDTPQAVSRFLRHWTPDAAIWVESELWPNMLALARARGVPLALVNARISARSYRRWQRAPKSIGALLGCFSHVFAQSEADAARLRGLGAIEVSCPGNLKYDAAPLPASDAALAALSDLLGARTRWLAASIHPGEDEAVAAAHIRLKRTYPHLLLTVVPRHPHKAGMMRDTFARHGLSCAMRSMGESPYACDVYIADTLGELGLFYRTHPIAFIGGSLIEHGGQNPFEAAQLGCAGLMGPYMFNFNESRIALLEAGGAAEVDSPESLAGQVMTLTADEQARARMGAQARAWAEGQGGASARIASALDGFLKE